MEAGAAGGDEEEMEEEDARAAVMQVSPTVRARVSKGVGTAAWRKRSWSARMALLQEEGVEEEDGEEEGGE